MSKTGNEPNWVLLGHVINPFVKYNFSIEDEMKDFDTSANDEDDFKDQLEKHKRDFEYDVVCAIRKAVEDNNKIEDIGTALHAVSEQARVVIEELDREALESVFSKEKSKPQSYITTNDSLVEEPSVAQKVVKGTRTSGRITRRSWRNREQ